MLVGLHMTWSAPPKPKILATPLCLLWNSLTYLCTYLLTLCRLCHRSKSASRRRGRRRSCCCWDCSVWSFSRCSSYPRSSTKDASKTTVCKVCMLFSEQPLKILLRRFTHLLRVHACRNRPSSILLMQIYIFFARQHRDFAHSKTYKHHR